MYDPSLELGLPHPFSRKQVCLPPQAKGWGGHTRLRLKGWGSPNSNEGSGHTLWCSIYISTLCCRENAARLLFLYLASADASSSVASLPLLSGRRKTERGPLTCFRQRHVDSRQYTLGDETFFLSAVYECRLCCLFKFLSYIS